MKLEVSKVEVWSASLEDRPGALAEKLAALSDAGANLEFVLARREPAAPGTGVVFIAPIKGARQTKAAAGVGLAKSGDLCALRVEGADKPGLGAAITRAIAQAGVNLRGLTAVAAGRKAVAYLAFDSADDARKAAKAIKAGS